MTLVEAVTLVLRTHEIPFALIGAAAMAVHGVSRSTADVDFLTTDPRSLEAATWQGLAPPIAVDIRRGDAADPLLGVVRARSGDAPDVDVIVGRARWQSDSLTRAAVMTSDGIPVVELPDLILLKLYAGGSQDLWDIEQLLAADVTGDAVRFVDARIVELPADAQTLWLRVRTNRR